MNRKKCRPHTSKAGQDITFSFSGQGQMERHSQTYHIMAIAVWLTYFILAYAMSFRNTYASYLLVSYKEDQLYVWKTGLGLVGWVGW